MFLKRETKILLKCTETELNAYINVCVCIQREKEKKRKEGSGERRREGERERSHNQFHHILSSWMLLISVVIKFLLHFQCTIISETQTVGT